MRELPVIACALDAAGQAARAEEFRALVAGALLARTEKGRGALLRFDPAHEAAVRDLLAREQQCCSFWDIRIARDDGALLVEITGPPEAAPLLDRLTGPAG